MKITNITLLISLLFLPIPTHAMLATRTATLLRAQSAQNKINQQRKILNRSYYAPTKNNISFLNSTHTSSYQDIFQHKFKYIPKQPLGSYVSAKNHGAFGALCGLGIGAGIIGWQEYKKRQEQKHNNAIVTQKEQEKNEIKGRVIQKIVNNDSSFVDDIITCLEKDLNVSWLLELYKKYDYDDRRNIDKLIFYYFYEIESNSTTDNDRIKRFEQCNFLINNIVQLFKQGIEVIIFDPIDPWFFDAKYKLAKESSTILKIKTLLKDALKHNFETIITINHQSPLLYNNLSRETLCNYTVKHFDSIMFIKNGEALNDLLMYIDLKNNSALRDKLIEHMADDSRLIGNALTILQNFPCDKTVIQKIEKKTHKKNDIFAQLLLKKIAQCKGCNAKNTMLTTTQTEYHLHTIAVDSHYENLFYSILPYTYNPELKQMFHSLNSKAQELEKKGYATFVHGQRWEYQFAEDLFTHLWQLNTNKSANNFVFAHVKDPAIFADYAKEETIHADAIRYGRNDLKSDNRQRLLFLNYAFFSNALNLGSSTAHYIASNDNAGEVRVNTKDIFNYFNKSSVHEKYEAELDALQDLHKKLTTYGNCFLIAVPQDQLDQSIFTAKVGGSKRDIKPSKALKLLKSDSYKSTKKIDKIEFCLPMTNSQYGGLNPESGIKIFDFNAVPQKEWQQYMKKRNALFAKIARDIRANQPSSFDSWYEHIV